MNVTLIKVLSVLTETTQNVLAQATENAMPIFWEIFLPFMIVAIVIVCLLTKKKKK